MKERPGICRRWRSHLQCYNSLSAGEQGRREAQERQKGGERSWEGAGVGGWGESGFQRTQEKLRCV